MITRPDTPTPWLNYLGQGEFGGIISNTAGGFSFDRDPRDRRVTRYRYNAIPADQPGRYVYLRDRDSGLFWSPTWQPVRRDLDAYECRHGPGYTRIRGALGGIETEILYFVPPGDAAGACPCELWSVRIRNAGARRRRLRSFTYAEFGFFDALADQHNLDWTGHIVSSRFVDGAILVSTRFRPTTSFFASSEPPVGWTGDREDFVGRCRDLARPIVVETGRADQPGLAARELGRLALSRPGPGAGGRAAARLRPGRDRRAERRSRPSSRGTAIPAPWMPRSTSCGPAGTRTSPASRSRPPTPR